jgi:Arc-like DNA binding domain
MAPKDQELRPVMTRIPEGLRRRLEREARWGKRSMNAEIVTRLQQSFDVPDQTDDIVSQVESAVDSAEYSITTSLDQIQSQMRAILAHLGLPDPVEEAKARKAERVASPEARKAQEAPLKSALDTIERTFGPGSIARLRKKERPSDTSETKDEGGEE